MEELEKKLNEYKNPIDKDSIWRQLDEIKRGLIEQNKLHKQMKSLNQAFCAQYKSNSGNLFQMASDTQREIEELKIKLNEYKKNPIDDYSVMRQVDEIEKGLIESEEKQKQIDSLYQAFFGQERKSHSDNLFQMASDTKREIEEHEKKWNEKNPFDDDSVMREVDKIRKGLHLAFFDQELKSKL